MQRYNPFTIPSKLYFLLFSKINVKEKPVKNLQNWRVVKSGGKDNNLLIINQLYLLPSPKITPFVQSYRMASWPLFQKADAKITTPNRTTKYYCPYFAKTIKKRTLNGKIMRRISDRLKKL